MSQKSKKPVRTTRRQYDDEFKRDAVQMLLDGHPAASVVERLGLSGTNLLYRWKRELLSESGPVASSLDAQVTDVHELPANEAVASIQKIMESKICCFKFK